MAVPQHRTSKTRKRMRRSHFKLTAPTLTACPQCREMKLPHHVCDHCGYYKNRQIIAVK